MHTVRRFLQLPNNLWLLLPIHYMTTAITQPQDKHLPQKKKHEPHPPQTSRGKNARQQLPVIFVIYNKPIGYGNVIVCPWANLHVSFHRSTYTSLPIGQPSCLATGQTNRLTCISLYRPAYMSLSIGQPAWLLQQGRHTAAAAAGTWKRTHYTTTEKKMKKNPLTPNWMPSLPEKLQLFVMKVNANNSKIYLPPNIFHITCLVSSCALLGDEISEKKINTLADQNSIKFKTFHKGP